MRATICLALLLFCVAPLQASKHVDALLARSEARLGGLGGLGAEASVPPKPPFGEALVSPLNIATFLAGVGVAEGINAQLLNDPMKLQEYFVSLGQPLTYIAFMIFDMSRYTISRSLYPFTSNPHTISSYRDLNFIDKTGGYIALAGASTVLHLLFEIIYSPHFKKLQTASDTRTFKHNLTNLLRENFLSTDRWIGRGIGTTTLLAAAVSQGYIAGLRMPLQQRIKSTIYRAIATRPIAVDDLLLHTSYDGQGLFVEDIVSKTKGQIDQADIAKYLHQPIKLKKITIMLPRFKLKGKYLTFTGAGIGLVLHVLDMALFIEFDHLYTALIDQPIWQFIHTQRINKLTAAIKSLCLNDNPDLQQLRGKLDQLSRSWFDYRMLFVVKLLMNLRSWHDELQRQDRRFYQRLSFYRWLLKGGDYHDGRFRINNHRWHAEPHTAEFQRTKTKMLKDMLYGFRQWDFFNYSFYRKTIAQQHFPAIIPPAKRQQYPQGTLALLQHIQQDRATFMSMFEQWGRDYGEVFEQQRRSFIGRYNAKTREEFNKIYLTDKHSIGSLKRLPSSPFLAFDHEIDDLFALLHLVIEKNASPPLNAAFAELKNYYAGFSLRRDENFLLDQQALEDTRVAIAAHWEKIRQHLAQLPPATRSLVELLAERVELTMIFRFSYVSLGSYLLDKKHIYLEQEGSDG